MFGVYQPGFLTARRRPRRSTRVDRRHADVAYTGRLRLRARRPDHQGQARGSSSASRRRSQHRLHAHDQAPDRLPQASCPNGTALDVRAGSTPTACPTSIRRPASTSPISLDARGPQRDRADVQRRSRKINYRGDAGAPGPDLSLHRAAERAAARRGSTAPRSTAASTTGLTTDAVGASGPSKLNDNKTEVEAVVGGTADARQRRARSRARRAAARRV